MVHQPSKLEAEQRQTDLEGARKRLDSALKEFWNAEAEKMRILAIPKGKKGAGKKAKEDVIKAYEDAQKLVAAATQDLEMLEEAQKQCQPPMLSQSSVAKGARADDVKGAAVELGDANVGMAAVTSNAPLPGFSPTVTKSSLLNPQSEADIDPSNSDVEMDEMQPAATKSSIPNPHLRANIDSSNSDVEMDAAAETGQYKSDSDVGAVIPALASEAVEHTVVQPNSGRYVEIDDAPVASDPGLPGVGVPSAYTKSPLPNAQIGVNIDRHMSAPSVSKMAQPQANPNIEMGPAPLVSTGVKNANIDVIIGSPGAAAGVHSYNVSRSNAQSMGTMDDTELGMLEATPAGLQESKPALIDLDSLYTIEEQVDEGMGEMATAKAKVKKRKRSPELDAKESDDHKTIVSDVEDDVISDSDVDEKGKELTKLTRFLKSRKKKANLDNEDADDKIMNSFDSLDEAEQQAIERDGNEAVTEFLRNPAKFGLAHSLRKLIRTNQSFLARAATTSRVLALEVFETNRRNIICPYHQRWDKGGIVIDGQGKYALNGVPYARSVRKKITEPVIQRPAGHLHCGCNEDVVLADFYFWKTWRLTSNATGTLVSESLRDQMLPPRLRAFVVAEYFKATGLTIDDLYVGKKSPHEHEVMMLKKQIGVLIGRLNKLTNTEGKEGEYYLG